MDPTKFDATDCLRFQLKQLLIGIASDLSKHQFTDDNQKLHRDNLPATLSRDVKLWLQNGLNGKAGAPVIVKIYTFFRWYRHGEIHRDQGQPACISFVEEFQSNLTESSDWWTVYHKDPNRHNAKISIASQEWWENGELHREGDNPAIIREDGFKLWAMHGKRCRASINDPAVITTDGWMKVYENDEFVRRVFNQSK
jgi:hypothetical protein